MVPPSIPTSFDDFSKKVVRSFDQVKQVWRVGGMGDGLSGGHDIVCGGKDGHGRGDDQFSVHLPAAGPGI